MAKNSGDYSFSASRKRDGAVVIRGAVLGPPGCEPYLIRAYETRKETRSFRLGFRNHNAEVPFVEHSIEHREEDVPTTVDTIKIYLPNEDVFVIQSQARADRLKAGPAVPNDEVTVQLEDVQLAPGVLDALGEALKARGFRGRMIVGKSRGTDSIFLCHRRYMNRPVMLIVRPVELATPQRAEIVASRFDDLRREGR